MSKKQIIFIIKAILFVGVVWWVGRALRDNLRHLDWRSLRIAWPWVYAAGAGVVAVTFTQISAYRLLLRSYGQSITWRQACTLSWVPALGKYVPGKVASILGTMVLLARYRIEPAIALSVALLGDALAVLTGLVVGSFCLESPLIREKIPGSWIWSVLLISCGLICLYPPVFLRLVSWALAKMKRPPLRASPSMLQFLLPLVMAFTQWICWGVALWCCARALGAAVTPANLPAFITFIALANTIGYLALFSPGGIGVREGILMVGLTPYLAPELASATVLGLRVVQTIVELILAALGALLIPPAPEATVEISSSGR